MNARDIDLECRCTWYMSAIDLLYAEAARLPADQRLALSFRLLALDEPEVTPDVEMEWDTAIRERIRALDLGAAETRPAGEVFAERDQRLGK